MIHQGDLVRLPGEDRFVKVKGIDSGGPPHQLFVEGDDPSSIRQVTLTQEQLELVERLKPDGSASSEQILAALWAEWMGSAATNTTGAAMISSQLTPYPHQHQAVYQRMLPQPMLRFLLGDEPGTGKTIMGGLYAREAQRLGIVKRCLVVCPAHLVTKWQADFDRFLGGGLRRVDNDTVKLHALRDGLAQGDGFWVVSLELAAMNSAVLEAIHPDVASWDLVIFDEAHRLTPSAETLHRVGRVLSKNVPRALMMTATPHRGNEWLFRSLMHLVDPEVFPDVEANTEHTHRLVPGPMHFLRRMKEELYDYDNKTRLFHDRHAENVRVHLSSVEFPFYQQALDLVDRYFPAEAKTLGRMVYGKRAASCLYSLGETLRRRHERMGTLSEAEAIRDEDFGDPFGDDEAARDHARVIAMTSSASAEEKREIKLLLEQIDKHLSDPHHSGPEDLSSKWPRMVEECLTPNGIRPGSGEQVVVFTEYADTAEWLVDQFKQAGWTAERYSGRDSHTWRDEVRDRFMAREFEVIVSTDAGNEGIDLQAAHVLVNWDIPWSLVTLEQRMGRIHRVGQTRDVFLYNLIATGTLEGDTYAKLLDRLVSAANEMSGKMFDCLSLVGEKIFNGKTTVPLAGLFEGGLSSAEAQNAIEAITQERLRQAAEDELARERALATEVDLKAAIEALQEEQLERVNPHIVERYLHRMASADLLEVKQSPLAPAGLFTIERTDRLELPKQLITNDPPTLVATWSSAKSEAVQAGAVGASRAIELTPAAEAFRALVDRTSDILRPSLFRGGLVQDETTTTDYTLFLFETPASEGPRKMRWRQLVRVDGAGARAVRFDILNNLVPVGGTLGAGYHPGEHHQAVDAVREAVAERQQKREEVLDEWHTVASRQLRRLPSDLVRGVDDREERRAIRDRASQAVDVRARALRAASDLKVEASELIGWAKVLGRGEPEAPTEKDSDLVAMRHVIQLLREAGYDVADVSQERVGYDARARRHYRQRLIEVKGIWESAATTGIRLTGEEMIRAGIYGDDYWLYVVDQCHDGKGTLRKVVRDPARVFDGLTRDVAILSIKGSDLMDAPFDDPV